jgi:uncharacterized protein with beta-barrel porin domain
VSPLDAKLFNAQTAAFANLDASNLISLMNRPKADSGGNTLFNFDSAALPEGRVWFEAGNDVLSTTLDDAPGYGFHAGTFNLLTGADFNVGNAGRLGAAFNYANTSLHDDAGGSAKQNDWGLNLYGSTIMGPIGLSAVFGYTHGESDTDRATGIGLATESHGDQILGGGVQAALPLNLGPFLLTPTAGVLVSSLHTSGFSETAPVMGFALTGSSTQSTVVSPYALAMLSREFQAGNGLTLTPDVEAGYRSTGGMDGTNLTLTASDATLFTGNKLTLDHGSALVGASLTAHWNTWSVFVEYRGNFASNWNDQSFMAGLRYAF